MRPLRRARARSRRMLACAAVVAVAGSLALVGASGSRAGALASPTIDWRGCGGGFQCGTLAVSVDDATPDRTVALSVIRQRARRPSARIGTLVLNPGGPGVPAVDFLRNVAATLPGSVRDRFDLVAFDPRGVGGSQPIQCTSSLDPFFDQPFQPATPAQRSALVAAATAVAQQCAARNGDYLAHVGTADAVRDLERLRVALGDGTVSYVGYSYGTYLGAAYAQAHPDRVRAMVLDGPIDPTLSARATTLGQARGFERALDDFLDNCSDNSGCAFHHGGHAARAYDALRARADRAPLAARDAGGRTLNQTRFDAAVLQQLYLGRNAWSGLARALADADDGDASSLLAGADAFVGRDADGSDDHVLDAFWAVTCLDGPVVAGADAAAKLEADAVAIAPRLGAFIVNNSLPCSVWTVPARPPTPALAAVGAPPILVIGTTKDPATPLAQARDLAGTLARGRLLVAVGEQHTSFDNGNACVDRAVSRYLLDRQLPRRGTRC